jgi:hypothetical protein
LSWLGCSTSNGAGVGDAGQGGTNATGGTHSSTGGNTTVAGSGTGGMTSCEPACGGLKRVCDLASLQCVECLDNSACGGKTSICDTNAKRCVECLDNSACGGTTPLCDTSKSVCVECLTSTDCKDPAAVTCIDGSCEPCSTNDECEHIFGKHICKPESTADAGDNQGTCVACTVDDETACGGNSCNPVTNTCTNIARNSVGKCQPCEADSECIGGPAADGSEPSARCIRMTFNGQPHGTYCLQRVASGCVSPYTVPTNATSQSGANAEDYCGPNQVATTCEAVLDLIASKSCQSDGDCGHGQGGVCKTVGVLSNRCTIPCDSVAQCLASAPGNACATDIPYCH